MLALIPTQTCTFANILNILTQNIIQYFEFCIDISSIGRRRQRLYSNVCSKYDNFFISENYQKRHISKNVPIEETCEICMTVKNTSERNLRRLLESKAMDYFFREEHLQQIELMMIIVKKFKIQTLILLQMISLTI